MKFRPKIFSIVVLILITFYPTSAFNSWECAKTLSPELRECIDTALIQLGNYYSETSSFPSASSIQYDIQSSMNAIHILAFDSLPTELIVPRDSILQQLAKSGNQWAQLWIFASQIQNGTIAEQYVEQAPSPFIRQLLGHHYLRAGKFDLAWKVLEAEKTTGIFAYDRAWLDMYLHWPKFSPSKLPFIRQLWPDQGALACLDAFAHGNPLSDTTSASLCRILQSLGNTTPDYPFDWIVKDDPLLNSNEQFFAMLGSWIQFQKMNVSSQPEKSLLWLQMAAFYGHPLAKQCLLGNSIDKCIKAQSISIPNMTSSLLLQEQAYPTSPRWNHLMKDLFIINPYSSNPFGEFSYECKTGFTSSAYCFLAL